MRRFEALSSKADIADSRVVMAGWYKGIGRQELLAPLANATWRPGAKEAIGRLQAGGVEVVVASITWRFAIECLVRPLGISNVLGVELGRGGEIGHVWPSDKGKWLRSLAKRLEVPKEHIAAVGDSVNDDELLAAASLRFFVGSGAAPSVHGLRVSPAGDVLEIAREILDFWYPSLPAEVDRLIAPEVQPRNTSARISRSRPR
jgi:phosphoserine phosphatase